MKDITKLWVSIVCLLLTCASILWATSADRSNAWAAIHANSKEIISIRGDVSKISKMSEDIAVIKEIMKRYEQQLQDKGYLK